MTKTLQGQTVLAPHFSVSAHHSAQDIFDVPPLGLWDIARLARANNKLTTIHWF